MDVQKEFHKKPQVRSALRQFSKVKGSVRDPSVASKFTTFSVQSEQQSRGSSAKPPSAADTIISKFSIHDKFRVSKKSFDKIAQQLVDNEARKRESISSNKFENDLIAPKQICSPPICTFLKVESKLNNWIKWMEIRKKFHKRVQQHLNRKPREMVMNKSDNYLQKVQDRMKIINAQINEPDKYRGCPNFWYLPLEVKHEFLPPIYGQYTKEQKCEIPEMEFVGIPNCTLEEKGLISSDEYVSYLF